MSDLIPDRSFSEKEFWKARPLLEYTKLIASKRRKSPYALLGWVMVFMLTRVSYQTSYVSAVGAASLNMLFLISGATGGGKSAARKVALEVFEFEDFGWSTPSPLQAGSGEAIADSFYLKEKTEDEDGKTVWVDQWINPNHCRIFFNDEISFHKGKAHQNSSTLEATYLSSYSGDALGRVLAGGKGKEVPAGEYRMITVFNAQPEHDPFRDDSSISSGMPSRLLNLKAMNKNARVDYESTLRTPEPAKFQIPHFGLRGDRMPSQFRALPEMEAAHAEEDFAASEGTRELGRSHTLLTRAKIACVLAALEGRGYLLIDDWHLAGHLIDHSNLLDDEIKKTLRLAARKQAGHEGALLGVRQDSAEVSKAAIAFERVKKNLAKHAEMFGYDLSQPAKSQANKVALSTLRQKISGRDRELVEPALNKILEEKNA